LPAATEFGVRFKGIKDMNYIDTFILVANDCPAEEGIIPVVKEGKILPIHAIQYSFISENPYKFTQEDVLFRVFAKRNSLSETDSCAREEFLEKEQLCLRTSALAKKYGWGFHFDSEGKVSLFGKGSAKYNLYSGNKDLKLLKALRNKRAK
jgi:hypothetical protein